MINFDDVIKEETKEHNPSWSSIQNINNGGSGSGKTNWLLNLINEEP